MSPQQPEPELDTEGAAAVGAMVDHALTLRTFRAVASLALVIRLRLDRRARAALAWAALSALDGDDAELTIKAWRRAWRCEL